jgi:hypothetical protein
MTWNEFTQVMMKRFMPIQAEDIARQKLFKMVQGSRTVQEYMKDFMNESQRVPSMDDATRKQLFINGLNPTIQWEISKNDKPEDTLETMILHATKLDATIRHHFNKNSGRSMVPPGFGRNNSFPNRQRYGNNPRQAHYFRPQNHPTYAASNDTSVPMELGNLRLNFDQTAEDETNELSAIDQYPIPEDLDEDIDEDMEYSIVAAMMQNQRNRFGGNGEQREYKPKWHKIIPNLTASEEIRLFKERKCYICRGSGHRLFRCPKIIDGSFAKRDRVNNIQINNVGETASDDEENKFENQLYSEIMSKNGMGQ